MIRTNDDGVEVYHRKDGQKFHCGLKPADMTKMKAHKAYSSVYETILEKDWPKKGGGTADFMPFRWNQGNVGSCGGHGSVAAFTATWNFQQFEPNKPILEFSPTFTYGTVNGGADNGSTPQDLLGSLRDKGCCLMSTVGEDKYLERQFPKSAYPEALKHRADNLLVINTFEELATAMIRRHSPFTGIFCGNNFDPDHNGRIAKWDRSQVGGHCTAQIGELEYVQGMGWGAWTLNGWGQDWGLGGWCWLHRSFFDGGLPVFAGVVIGSVIHDPDNDTPTPTPHEKE